LRWRARQRWAEHDSYLRVVRRRRGRAVVGPDTEIVIEGFPRSANTFAVFAFQMAQPRPVPIAHHLHSPAQVTAAARRGLPVLLLIRSPRDAVVSSVMWWPYVTPADALGAYARFYEAVRPVRDALVIGRFAEVTADLGLLTDRLNARYGTAFGRFAHTADNVERCYRLIDERSGEPDAAAAINAYMSGLIGAAELDRLRPASVRTTPPLGLRVARPSPERAAHRDGVVDAYLAPHLDAARARAERVYRDFVGD
jgi:hypothetical protein